MPLLKTASIVLGAVCVALMLSANQASAQNDAALKRGRMLWTNRGCGSCHGIGKKMAGPDLAGVEQRRSREWLNGWLKDTDKMLRTDSTAIGLLAEWKGIKMPTLTLTDQDIEAVLAYLRFEEGKKGK